MVVNIANFNAGSLEDLLGHLTDLENASGVVVSVAGLTSTGGGNAQYFHTVGFRRRTTTEDTKTIDGVALTGTADDAQRAEIVQALGESNAPVDYANMIFLENGNPVARDVFFFRPDGGAWFEHVANPPGLAGNIAARIPWTKGRKGAASFRSYTGLSKEGFTVFTNADGKVCAVSAITDADIDTDGPNGSKQKDRYWSPHTSLRDSAHESCDSRTFPGVVIPPGVTTDFGVHVGDFALLSLNGREVAAQVYDVGPANKIGEISFHAAVALGIYKDVSPQTEKDAATKGNSVQNLLTVFFPGSGDRRAVATDLIQQAVDLNVASWLGAPAAAGGAGPAASGPQTFEQFVASLNLAHVTLDQVRATTGQAPNAMPDRSLWQNIAPTLVVLDEIAKHFDSGLRVNSTYRNVAYNSVVDGAKRSQHIAFRAVDFSILGQTPEKVAEYAKSLRGRQFPVPIAHLQLTNMIPGLSNPPPLNLSGLSLNTIPGVGTTFVYHGGIQDYSSFVHIDCRGEDVSWG